MIPISPKDEPKNFESDVRKPGKKYLKRVPNPTNSQWKNHAHWLKVKHELRAAFGSICAYSAHWVSDDTGWATCEHFLDKKFHPEEAYEWDNYRFVCGILNGRKGNNFTLDPIGLKDGTFILDFPSLLIKPSDELSDEEYEVAVKTRDILGLNDEQTCLKSRLKYIMEYSNNCINLEFLQRHAPFIFAELIRQNLTEDVKALMLLGQFMPPNCLSE